LLPPQLLSDVNDGMTVMQDEIFGPLLPLVPYDSSTKRSLTSPRIRIRWRCICSSRIRG
jgi:hypothetical protein